MKINVYTVRDIKVGNFAQPFFSPTHGSALRAFADHVNDPQSMPNKHPGDFDLYHLGSYDDETGIIDGLQAPAFLGHATEYKENKP